MSELFDGIAIGGGFAVCAMLVYTLFERASAYWRGWVDGVQAATDAAAQLAREDTAIAAGTQGAETSETSARSEGCQSGPKGIAQGPSA